MKNYIKILYVCSLFAVLAGSFIALPMACATSPNEESVGDSWTSKTSLQQARGGLGVVAVDDKIYAIGGKTVEGFIGTNEQYDTKTDTWIPMKSMPTSRAYFAIVAYGGKIYCIGGLNNGGVCSVNEVYDVATDSWSAKASLPVSGGNLQGGVVDGKIFVLVGCDLFMYDPIVDGWIQKTSIFGTSSASSNFVALSVVDDSLIVIGNFTVSSSRTELRVRIYDPQADAWGEGAKPVFEAIGGVVGVTSGSFASKYVYFFGTSTAVEYYPGFSQTYVDLRPFVKVYDPVKDVWITSVAGATNRVDFGVAVVDDVLYVIGGYSVVMEETVITVGKEDYVPGTMHFETQIVYTQYQVSRPVVGDATALNLQYVPAGYSSVVVSEPPNSTSKPDNSFNGLVVVGILVLIIMIIAVGLVLYFKKR
jgi:hypothetical protein